jgi:hypothetical protein
MQVKQAGGWEGRCTLGKGGSGGFERLILQGLYGWHGVGALRPSGAGCRCNVVHGCKARPMQRTVRDGGPSGGDFGVLRCVECSSAGDRAKTTRVWLGFSQEHWMGCSKCLSLDWICVCARCLRFPGPAKVGAPCMVLEYRLHVHAPYERSTPIKS